MKSKKNNSLLSLVRILLNSLTIPTIYFLVYSPRLLSFFIVEKYFISFFHYIFISIAHTIFQRTEGIRFMFFSVIQYNLSIAP